MKIIAIDLETTGLDIGVHWATEIAWVEDAGLPAAVGTLVPWHSLDGATEKALKMQNYSGRIAGRKLSSGDDMAELHKKLSGARLLGSNVRFDAAFLAKTFAHYHLRPVEPWHYRLLDVEAYGAGVLGTGWGDVPSLHTLAVKLGMHWDDDHTHTALYDCLMAMRVYRGLYEIAQTRGAMEEAERAFEANLIASIGGSRS